jgi:hypothetical protein
VRIQGVGLEDHCDITVLGLDVVHEPVSDVYVAFGYLFETGKETKGGGFAAAGRANEDQELLVRYLEIEIIDRGRSVFREALCNVLVSDFSHRSTSPVVCSHVR